MVKRFFRVALNGVLVMVCAGSSALVLASDKIHTAETVYASEVGAQSSRFVSIRSNRAAFVKRFALAPVDSVQVESVLARLRESGRLGLPKQIGFGRDVRGLSSSSAVRKELVWQTQPDGAQVAALSIVSPGAAGLRLGVRIYSLPAEAVIRVHAPDDDTAIQFNGREILDLINGNVAAGDDSEDAFIWWTPTIEAEEAVLDIVLPPGVPANSVEVALPGISHLFASANTGWKAIGDFAVYMPAQLSCHTDINCQPAWDAVSRATAHMLYLNGRVAYVCTGTLLNANNTAQPVPYFLTADHCISSQTIATTLETYWLRRSPSCRATGLSREQQRLTGGGTLLYNSAANDVSFLRLNATPPTGVAYAGWQASTPTIGMAVAGVHHPGDDRQKFAAGSVSGWAKRIVGKGDSLSMMSSSASAASHLSVIWSNGATEGGSSGSGVFDSRSQKLIGVLSGGPSFRVCSGGPDYYGRFDLAFNAKLRDYLDPVVTRKFNLSVQRSGSGTVAGQGINCGSDCTEQYTAGTQVTLTATPASGYSFSGWSGACSGGSQTCTLAMNADKSVSAAFAATVPPPAAKVTLTVQRSGAGTGTVTGSGINCGLDCSEQYTSGSKVTLTAVPALGSVFAGWSGACSGTSQACVLTMSASKSVTAAFNSLKGGSALGRR